MKNIEHLDLFSQKFTINLRKLILKECNTNTESSYCYSDLPLPEANICNTDHILITFTFKLKFRIIS